MSKFFSLAFFLAMVGAITAKVNPELLKIENWFHHESRQPDAEVSPVRQQLEAFRLGMVDLHKEVQSKIGNGSIKTPADYGKEMTAGRAAKFSAAMDPINQHAAELLGEKPNMDSIKRAHAAMTQEWAR